MHIYICKLLTSCWPTSSSILKNYLTNFGRQVRRLVTSTGCNSRPRKNGCLSFWTLQQKSYHKIEKPYNDVISEIRTTEINLKQFLTIASFFFSCTFKTPTSNLFLFVLILRPTIIPGSHLQRQQCTGLTKTLCGRSHCHGTQQSCLAGLSHFGIQGKASVVLLMVQKSGVYQLRLVVTGSLSNNLHGFYRYQVVVWDFFQANGF